MIDYRDKFIRLSRFALIVVTSEEEQRRRFEWGLNLTIRAALARGLVIILLIL